MLILTCAVMNWLAMRQSRLQYYIKFSRKTRKCDEMLRNGRVVSKDFYDFKISMMIFKSLCLQKPLHLYFWDHKNLGHFMPAGAFGAVRPVGAILPTAFAAGPLRSRSHGRLRRSEGPSRPVMFRWWIISVTDHANMALTWTDKWQMIPRQITMSLEKRNLACKTNNTKLRSCLRRRDKIL